jgi:hypothetical protein
MAVDFLYMIDPNTMILGSFFIITLALFLWVFGKFFKENNSVKAVLSFTLALLSTWGLNRANIDVSQFVYSRGISEETIYLIAPILFIGFLFLIGLKKDKTTGRRKFSLSRMLIVLGILLIASSLFGLVYQKEILLYVGAIIAGLGIFLSWKSKKKGILSSDSSNNYYRNIRKQQIANQKISEKQKEWENRQYQKEVRKRAEKINEIRNRKEKNVLSKKIQDERWAEEQQRENKERKRQQEKEQIEYEKQQRKKEENEQKWAREQLKRAEKQRIQQFKEQQKYQERDKKRVEEEKYKELQKEQRKQQEKEARMQQRRQESIQQLKSLYNQKYQEAMRQQNFAAKGIPGAREKYLQLQRETQRIVDKINRI